MNPCPAVQELQVASQQRQRGCIAHHGGGRTYNTSQHGAQNTLADACGESEVVGIDDQLLQVLRTPARGSARESGQILLFLGRPLGLWAWRGPLWLRAPRGGLWRWVRGGGPWRWGPPRGPGALS